jgi:lysophospholipase L1-like esterase
MTTLGPLSFQTIIVPVGMSVSIQNDSGNDFAYADLFSDAAQAVPAGTRTIRSGEVCSIPAPSATVYVLVRTQRTSVEWSLIGEGGRDALDNALKTPADIPGVLSWHSMSSMSDTDFEAVGSWPSVVRSDPATASGSARPTLRTSIANNHKGLFFDGVNNVMLFTKKTGVRSVVMVCRFDRPFTSLGALVGDTGVTPPGGEYGLAMPDASEPQLFDAATDATLNGGSVWLNGVKALPYTAPRPTALSVVVVRTAAPVGLSNFSMDRIAGRRSKLILSEAALFDRVIDDGEALAMTELFCSLYDIPFGQVGNEIAAHLIACGDSLAMGQGSSAGNDALSLLVAGLPGGKSHYMKTNLGVGGLLARQTYEGSFFQAVIPSMTDLYSKKILIQTEGTNDLFSGETAAITYSYLCGTWAMARAAGLKIITHTILPRNNVGTPGGFEAARQALNTLIRSNPMLYDKLSDIGADSRIGVAGACADTTYFNVDQVHLNDAGYAVIAELDAAQIGDLL